MRIGRERAGLVVNNECRSSLARMAAVSTQGGLGLLRINYAMRMPVRWGEKIGETLLMFGKESVEIASRY